MTVLIHDLTEPLPFPCAQDIEIIPANGKYAPCQGCFGCWTKHPAECFMKDALHTACRTIGHADNVLIVTANCFGAYSPAVKNVLDRSIGLSTPFSTYRGRQMHHTLRYGKKNTLTVYAYGNMTPAEEETFRLMVERNAINFGFREGVFHRVANASELKEVRV